MNDARTPRPLRAVVLGGPLAMLAAALLLPAAAAADAGGAKQYLYVANTLGGDISVIEVPSHKVVATIPASVVGNSPDDVISTRDGDVLYVSRLDTKDVEPTSHAGAGAAMRDDAVVPPLDPEAALANAPEREGDFFKVPPGGS